MKKTKTPIFLPSRWIERSGDAISALFFFVLLFFSTPCLRVQSQPLDVPPPKDNNARPPAHHEPDPAADKAEKKKKALNSKPLRKTEEKSDPLDTPAEMTPSARKAALHHKYQVGVEIGFGWGYRFIKPYGDIWCGERDDGDNAAFCLSPAPAFMNIGLSFGGSRHVDVTADFRYGLIKDRLSERNPLVLAAGARFWIDPNAAFKWAFGLQFFVDMTQQDGDKQKRPDYEAPKQDEIDVGGRFYGEMHYDLLRYVGFYIRLAGVVGALRWLRFELEGVAGVQARFP